MLPIPDIESSTYQDDRPTSADRHLSPAIRRINLTSDYESSESPSNSEYGENSALLDDSSGSACGIQEQPISEEEVRRELLSIWYRFMQCLR